MSKGILEKKPTDLEYGTEASRELALDLAERMREARSESAVWISAEESSRRLDEVLGLLKERAFNAEV